jgi:DeoR/GlpR family transcriptional regulator of sugar metabolism
MRRIEAEDPGRHLVGLGDRLKSKARWPTPRPEEGRDSRGPRRPGGRSRPGEDALTGPLARASLEAVRFDTAVIGCCGLGAAQGLTAYDLDDADDADVKRAAIASARRFIAVAEGSKLTRTVLAFVAPASALHVLITDTSAPDEEIRAISAAGVAVAQV